MMSIVIRIVAPIVAVLVAGVAGAGCQKKKAPEPKEAPAQQPATQQASVAPPDAPSETKASEPPPKPKPKMLRVELRSTPSGAKVSVDGSQVGETDLEFELEDDGKSHEFELTKDGYKPLKFKRTIRQPGLLGHPTLQKLPPDAGPG
jgi:hypothetical protein